MTTQELIHAAALLVENSWELAPEDFEAHLAAFVAASDDKIKALRYVCKAAEGRAAACKAEAAAFSAAAKVHANNADRVKGRAFLLMEAAEQTGEALSGARLQMNGGGAPLAYAPDFNARSLPSDLQRVIVEANADAIRAALQRGEPVPGVELAPVGRHLRWVEK